MAFKKKEWKPRQGTGLNKFKIGSNEPVEIINVPDEVTQQGDGFTSDNMNGLEQRIYSGCEGNFYKYYNDISEISDVISGYPGSKVTDIIIRGNTVVLNNVFVSVGSNVNTNTVIPVKLYSQSEVLENTYNIQYAKINNDNGLLGIGTVYDEFEYSSKKLIKKCSQIILSGLTWTLESEASPNVLMYKAELNVIENCDFIVNNGFTRINYDEHFDGNTQQIKIDQYLHITVLRSAITSAGSVNAVLSSLGAEIVIPIQPNVVILDEVPSIRINDTGKTKIGINNALFDVILVDEESRTGLYVSEALGNAIDVGQIVEECNETRTETANALINITADKNYIDGKAAEVTETATSGITQMNAILAQAQDIANVQSYKMTLTGGWAASTLPGVYLYVIGKLAVLMGRLQSPDVAGVTPIANPICTLPEGIKPLYTMETDIISSAKVNNLPDIHVIQLGKSSGTLVPYADTYKANTTYSFSFTFLIE